MPFWLMTLARLMSGSLVGQVSCETGAHREPRGFGKPASRPPDLRPLGRTSRALLACTFFVRRCSTTTAAKAGEGLKAPPEPRAAQLSSVDEKKYF